MTTPNYDDPLGSGDEALGDDLNDFVNEAIGEANEDAIKEAVEKTLHDDGFKATPELVQTGHDKLTKKVDTNETEEEETTSELPKTIGPAPKTSTPHIKDTTPRDKEFLAGTKDGAAEISKRERLEAEKKGLILLMNKLAKTLTENEQLEEQYDVTITPQEKYGQEHKLLHAQERVWQIESEIANLPQPKEIDLENLPECKREHMQILLRNKQARLEEIRDMCAEGIEANNKWGMDALGELTNEHDRLIRQARKEPEEAFE